MADFDLAVVGLGVTGLSTVLAASRRGARVIGLDRHGLVHAEGSSHGGTRIFRSAYFEHPDYVPLLEASRAGWRDLEARSGRPLLHACGVIYAGPPAGEVVGGTRRAAEAHGIPHQALDRAALGERYPMLALPDSHAGLLEPGAGYLRCEEALAALAEVALRHGAQLRARCAVRGIESDAAGVLVHTDDGTFRAERAVVCAGAWTAALLPELGWPLRPTRQVVIWTWPRRSDRFTLAADGSAGDALPCWAIERPDGRLHYGFPMARDGSTGVGFKLGLHHPGEPTEPDRIDRIVRPGEIAALRDFLRSTIPDADGPVLRASTCLYTNTPDGHFVIGRHPRAERILVASACSGHGFKFGPALGQALAESALDGETVLPIGFLDPSRFGG